MTCNQFSFAPRSTTALLTRLLLALLAMCLVTAWSVTSNIIRHLVRGEFACLLPPPRIAVRLALTTLNVADDLQPVEMPTPCAIERVVEMQAWVQKPGCYTAPASPALPPA